MNVLFITIDNVVSFSSRSIYIDLVNKFRREGHYVTVVSVCEKRDQKPDMPKRFEVDRGEVIKVFSPNVTKVSNYLMKGISLVYLNVLFKKAVSRAIKERKYDLVLYGSPPVTVYGAVELVKKHQGSYSYLLLKDIWPYDSVFGGVLSTKGWKGIAFNILKNMARRLYKVSDTIGCMSPANIKFLTENEPKLDKGKIEVNPNSVVPYGVKLSEENIINVRQKYGLPTDKVIFLYGGNLGIPQGIDFALEAIKEARTVKNAFFVFVGGGTANDLVEKAKETNDYQNLIFIPPLPKDEYDQFVYACDVGLIFLNHECLAPNYPSRLLSYMEAGLPVLCATDSYTDVGKIAEENDYGLSCESNEISDFVAHVNTFMDKMIRDRMGRNAEEYFHKYYTVDSSYQIIINRMQTGETEN
jgi:glycosyltransferase involved in cell wall biosynthesis